MKFLSQFIVVIFLSAFFACNSNKNNNTAKVETAISVDETSTEVKIKTYGYGGREEEGVRILDTQTGLYVE